MTIIFKFIFTFCRDGESSYVARAGLKLVASRNPPVLASRSAETTDGSHQRNHPYNIFFFLMWHYKIMRTNKWKTKVGNLYLWLF